MNLELLIARVLHIVVGIFWVGAMLFNTFLLGPAMADAGPDGAKVGAGLMRRGMATIMPVAAIVTMLSGLWLYWRVIGFAPEAMHSARAITFGLGALAAIIGFAFGMTFVRPAMVRSVPLSQALARAPESERGALLEQLASLRKRATVGGYIVTSLLLLAAVAMSIGRYV